MYLIGLTGNIASGKSTVRRLLEELGARAIDADVLAHAVLLRGTPAWAAVVDAFGVDILRNDGEVDRRKLGALVFPDPARLRRLEAIVHPAVSEQLGLLLRHAGEPVVVVEAVKLIEAGLHKFCDAVWIVTTLPEEAKRRLMHDRGLSEEEADVRLSAQPPLAEKLKYATVVIDNSGSVEATREQVTRAFAAIRPETATDKRPVIAALLGLSLPTVEKQAKEEGAPVSVRRARPGDTTLLAGAMAQAEGKREPLARAEVLQRLGKWGYWLAEADGNAVGLAAWKAENLVAIIRDLWLPSPDQASRVVAPLLGALEQEARTLQCEAAALIAGPQSDANLRQALLAEGYAESRLEELHPIWQSMVRGELAPNDKLYLKRLRAEMVSTPI